MSHLESRFGGKGEGSVIFFHPSNQKQLRIAFQAIRAKARHHSSRQRITSLGHPNSGGLGKSIRVHPNPSGTRVLEREKQSLGHLTTGGLGKPNPKLSNFFRSSFFTLHSAFYTQMSCRILSLIVHSSACFTHFISSQVLHCSTWETPKYGRTLSFNVNVPLGS
jgi:hypothetical protein